METQSIEIYLPALKATSRCMAKHDIRYYLNGVCVEADATQTILVATDGHRILATRRKAENVLDKPVRFIMPDDIVKLFTSQAGPRKSALSTIPFTKRDGNKWAANLFRMFSSPAVEFKPIEGIFPDWRKVVPDQMPVESKPVQMNIRYLSDFAQAAADLGHGPKNNKHLFVLHDGDGERIFVRLDGHNDTDFFGIVMGLMRNGGEIKLAQERPDWLGKTASGAAENVA